MLISDRRAQSFLPALYHTAAKDKSDHIANAASRLAVRFEQAQGKGFELSELDQRLIRYAVLNKPTQLPVENSRRKQYKRRVSVS